MSEMDWPVLSIVFIAIVLLTYGVSLVLGNRRKLKKRLHEPEEQPALTLLRRQGETNTLKRKLSDWLSFSGKWALKDGEGDNVRSLLIHGGFRQPNALTVFYGLKAVVALLFPIPILLFAVMRDNLSLGFMMFAFMMGAVGYLLPLFILKKVVKRRQDKIDRALPDVIDLFIICMEAGLALQATIARVAEEIQPVSREFHQEMQHTGGEMRTGISRDAALRNLGQRTGVPSVQSLVTLMIQSEKLGTSLAQSLRAHADFVRTQRTLKAEEMAGKLPVKIMVPLIFFIFPSMFIVVVGPGAIQLAKNLMPALAGR